MIRSLIYSLTFHSIMILLTILSLPFMLREPVDLPPIVSVELIQISDKTSIPYAPKARKIIEDSKKKEEKRRIQSRLHFFGAFFFSLWSTNHPFTYGNCLGFIFVFFFLSLFLSFLCLVLKSVVLLSSSKSSLSLQYFYVLGMIWLSIKLKHIITIESKLKHRYIEFSQRR